ncbi:MBL fold metallo-hydrolase [Planctellipticum variicoloris]|uniref:MBL fold metallo-hydrolase n=1 Tax=Planctellipticum variicoloris TaxID=3064265 RepID=UPI00301392AE|nr:MBL fold metallo-hydrolase [Planctomycetaceae bacterium SH412]
MAATGVSAEQVLVNGSTGDPVLYVDWPDEDNALLFDAGDNSALPMERLADLRAVFISHHHVDHFIGLDRIVRANIDSEKVLSIFGPPGTIQKVYDRIRSYEYQYFPFQQIVLDVVDVGPETLTRARLECSKRFPPPEPETNPRDGAVVFRSGAKSVEAVAVDHTVPCLAYALVEGPGLHFDAEALAAGPLKPGGWIKQVQRRLQEGAGPEETLTLQGLEFPLSRLAEQYFRRSPGGRIAFITDTLWSEAVREPLLRLARRATRLYCDSFYSGAHEAQAKKYRHMTASQAAALARDARVDELVLIHFSQRYRGRYDKLVAEAQEIFPKTTAQFE